MGKKSVRRIAPEQKAPAEIITPVQYDAIFNFELTHDAKISPAAQMEAAAVLSRTLHLVALGVNEVDYGGMERHDHGILIAGTAFLEQLTSRFLHRAPVAPQAVA